MPCVARLERGLEVAREGAPAALIQLLGKVVILAPNLWASVGKREAGKGQLLQACIASDCLLSCCLRAPADP